MGPPLARGCGGSGGGSLAVVAVGRGADGDDGHDGDDRDDGDDGDDGDRKMAPGLGENKQTISTFVNMSFYSPLGGVRIYHRDIGVAWPFAELKVLVASWQPRRACLHNNNNVHRSCVVMFLLVDLGVFAREVVGTTSIPVA